MTLIEGEERRHQRISTPYPRAWDDDARKFVTVPIAVSDRVEEPREINSQVIYFRFTDDEVEDDAAHEAAVILQQVAGWLLMHPGALPTAVIIRRNDEDRTTVELVVS